MKLIYVLSLVVALQSFSSAAIVVNFDSLPVDSSNFYNGDTTIAANDPRRANFESLGTRIRFGQTEFLQRWTDTGVRFQNNYIPAFSSWSGWSWSKVQDPTTAGFTNQYAAFPGGGANAAGALAPGGTYAIGFGNAYFDVAPNATLQSVDVTNTSYAGLSMRDGDAFAKKFGGASGNDADLFQVTFTGYTQTGATGATTGTRTVDLADFRFANNSLDYILSSWLRVDLTSLGNARSVGLSFFSTDVGAFGMNTPAFVAIDNLTLTLFQSLAVWFYWRPAESQSMRRVDLASALQDRWVDAVRAVAADGARSARGFGNKCAKTNYLPVAQENSSMRLTLVTFPTKPHALAPSCERSARKCPSTR